MPERKELSTPRRARIKTLFLDAHWPKKKISRELGVPRRTVQDVLKYPTSRRVRTGRNGRPPIISQRVVRRMLIAICRKYESRRLPYVELARSCGIEACENAIRAALRRAGYYKCVAFINEIQRQKRLVGLFRPPQDLTFGLSAGSKR